MGSSACYACCRREPGGIVFGKAVNDFSAAACLSEPYSDGISAGAVDDEVRADLGSCAFVEHARSDWFEVGFGLDLNYGNNGRSAFNGRDLRGPGTMCMNDACCNLEMGPSHFWMTNTPSLVD